MRIRAVAVVVGDGDVLLIDREKDGHVYSALPGGAIEPGETLWEACLRELREETGLRGGAPRLLDVAVDVDAPAFYLHVHVTSRRLQLGEPEVSRSSAVNTYAPRWVPLSELSSRNLLPAARIAISLAAGQ